MTDCFVTHPPGPATDTGPVQAGGGLGPPAAPSPARAPKRRSSQAARQDLMERIWMAAGRQVAEIEARLSRLGPDDSTSERDARSLALLARMVRELSLAESRKPSARKPPRETQEVDDDPPPRDPDALREELARRLERLRQARAGA